MKQETTNWNAAAVAARTEKEAPVAPTRLRDAILLRTINPSLSREDIDAMVADADRRAAEIQALLDFMR